MIVITNYILLCKTAQILLGYMGILSKQLFRVQPTIVSCTKVWAHALQNINFVVLKH